MCDHSRFSRTGEHITNIESLSDVGAGTGVEIKLFVTNGTTQDFTTDVGALITIYVVL